MRVWIDLTNTAHVVVLRPLVERLEAAGHEVELTARPLSHTLDLLDDWGHPYTALGAYGGVGKLGKARAATDRVVRMLRFGRARGFDAALAHGSTDLPVACRVLRIPNATMFDYEFAVIQHNVNCRLANRVLVPEAIPAERLARFGAKGDKLVHYPGLKEEYYLHGFTPDAGLPGRLGVTAGPPLAVVRTPPAYALYLGGAESALLPRVLGRLAEGGAQTVVLPRTPEQADAVDALGIDGVHVPRRAVDGRSLVALADLLVSAGGTMNREAAVLGTPVWSMFEGRLGAVDELLVHQGRLRLLRDPDDIVVTRKGPTAVPTLRDPGELLALALPWNPMSSFEPFDSRGYRTVDARTGYGAWAPTYEGTVQDAMDVELLDALTELDVAAATVADLGCGSGRTGAWLAAHGAAAIDGADVTPEMLEMARARGVFRALVEADVADTGLPGANYDVVTTSLVDEHLADLRPLYAEAARLLRPGGTYAIVGFHPHFIMASGMPTHFDDADGEPVAIVTHVHQLSDQVAAAHAAGLQLVELRERLVDDAWVALKPRWDALRGHPVSFAAVWRA